MEKHSELYFTTGEFAHILGVKKHTLFHYDEIGLFSPALTDESNGYRFYFLWQMDIFQIIKGLQETGMPLKEIKDYLEKRSPQRFLSMAREQERLINQEIERLKSMRAFLRSECNNIFYSSTVETDKPRLLHCPEQWILSSGVENSSERKLGEEIAQHIRMREKYNVTTSSVGAICRRQDLENGLFEHYVEVYTKTNKKLSIPGAKVQSEGEYVEVCYKGYEGNMEKPYHLIASFAQEQGLSLGEEWYEEFLLDELTVEGYENYLVLVRVAVIPQCRIS